MTSCFTLVKVFSYAENRGEAFGNGEFYFFGESSVGFSVILPSFGMSEDGIFASCRYEHVCRYLTCIGSFLLVGAVLCGKTHNAALYDFRNRYEVCEWRCYDQFDRGRNLGGFCNYCLCQFDTFGNVRVHFPVAGDYILSHDNL